MTKRQRYNLIIDILEEMRNHGVEEEAIEVSVQYNGDIFYDMYLDLLRDPDVSVDALEDKYRSRMDDDFYPSHYDFSPISFMKHMMRHFVKRGLVDKKVSKKDAKTVEFSISKTYSANCPYCKSRQNYVVEPDEEKGYTYDCSSCENPFFVKSPEVENESSI